MASSRRRTLEQRLAGGGPKRILSLDGGGVRGILSSGILAEVERRLTIRSGRPDFRLCEYFDLIGGASTGAILAAGLAMGKTCAEMTEIYREIAPEAVAAKGKTASGKRVRFDAFRLEGALARAFGDHEMSSGAVKTGLAIFARRAGGAAPWTVTNHPRSKLWDGGEGVPASKRLVVRKLVQASAAGPALLDEVRLKLDQDNAAVANAEGAFVDGALAGFSNPSVQLFKVATLKSYGFEWLAGEDQILMLSVGAGYWPPANDVLETVIHDTGMANVSTMQSLSRAPRPWRIDGELQDMRDDHLSPFPILTFQRMDARLQREELTQVALEYSDAEVAQMRDPANDEGATLGRLHETGIRTGQSYFRNPPGRDTRDWESLILPPRFDPTFFGERALGQPKTRLDAMGRLFERPPGPGE